MFLRNYWYVAASDHEMQAQAARPHHSGRAGRLLSAGGRHAGRARGSLRPPPPAAVDGQAGRRHAAMPLPRPALRQDRHLRAGARPGHDPALGPGQKLSGGRALSLAVDLDGRSGAGRSRQDHRFPLARRSELGRQGPVPARQGQLAADRRQPARPHASRLRARDHDRQLGAGRPGGRQGSAHATTTSWSPAGSSTRRRRRPS